MVLGAIGAFPLIRSYGETLVVRPAAIGEALTEPTAKTPDALLRVLVALTAVIIIGQILAKLFAYLRQPPVIGEVVAGHCTGAVAARAGDGCVGPAA
jgi:hypothetical protein